MLTAQKYENVSGQANEDFKVLKTWRDDMLQKRRAEDRMKGGRLNTARDETSVHDELAARAQVDNDLHTDQLSMQDVAAQEDPIQQDLAPTSPTAPRKPMLKINPLK